MLGVGDTAPADTVFMDMSSGEVRQVRGGELFGKGRVVVCAIPGAFTPTCSKKQVPAYIRNADAFRSRGVDRILCVSVNDPFVMAEWGKALGAGDKVSFIADPAGDFTRACGFAFDARAAGLGERSRRYSMLLEDGVVKRLNLEEGGAFTISGAEDLLAQI